MMERQETGIFELAFGNLAPWKITEHTFGTDVDSTVPELRITFDFDRGSTFLDQYGEPCKAYDTAWHTWRHLDFFQYACQITARVPRIKNSKGVIEKIQVPWARKNNGFTLQFEYHIMSLLQDEMPISGVARQVGEYDQRIWNIFSHYINKGIIETDFGQVTQIGIDETSEKKGHNYITVAVDLAIRRIIFVTDGKKANCVEKIAEELEKRGCPRENVNAVSIDMSNAFTSGTKTSFPNAEIIYDRFHVVKKVNEGLDEVRRAEKEEAQFIKGMRYSLLKKPENLSIKKFDSLWDGLMMMPTIGEAYRLKELIRDFWDFMDSALAARYLDDWCVEVYASGIPQMIKVANMIKRHWDGILKYIETRITNGILEGINSKIQLAKRRARGYRNTENFKLMVMFIGGKLNLPYFRRTYNQTH